ncbi:rod-binding protein [Vibrio sp. PNB22_3_1]
MIDLNGVVGIQPAQSNAGLVQPNLNSARDANVTFSSVVAAENSKLSEQDVALASACRGIESMFVQQMFSAMRQTSAAISEDSPLSVSGDGVFQEMLDQELVQNLSQSGSFGLAELMFNQMR